MPAMPLSAGLSHRLSAGTSSVNGVSFLSSAASCSSSCPPLPRVSRLIPSQRQCRPTSSPCRSNAPHSPLVSSDFDWDSAGVLIGNEDGATFSVSRQASLSLAVSTPDSAYPTASDDVACSEGSDFHLNDARFSQPSFNEPHLAQVLHKGHRPRILSEEDVGNNGRSRRDGGASPEYYAHLQARERSSTPVYSRVMLKVSGEELQGSQGFGTDPDVLKMVAEEVKAAYVEGIEICIVVGGGNYFRGASAWEGLNRATADYVGMLATVMNALCLQAALEQLRVPTRVQTAIEMREVAEPYVQRRAIRHLEEGRVVIFGAGTGNPFFTTDTAAALRAAEMDADVFLKATKVDGVYDSDPIKNPGAKRYNQLSFKQVTMEDLQVMDQTAITLCKENNIPVIVFSIADQGNILKAARGEAVGTTVCEWDEGTQACKPRKLTSSGTAS